MHGHDEPVPVPSLRAVLLRRRDRAPHRRQPSERVPGGRKRKAQRHIPERVQARDARVGVGAGEVAEGNIRDTVLGILFVVFLILAMSVAGTSDYESEIAYREGFTCQP